MKYKLFKIGTFLLIPYSIFIIASEILNGQEYVRMYLTDITGNVVFFAVNTTLTTIFLVLIAYNFILSAIAYKRMEKNKTKILLLLIQAILFFFLATDERFMIHERIGYFLDFNDAYILVTIGLCELFILYRLEELRWTSTLRSYSLYLGSLFFGAMILIDAFGANNALLRLSFEDLCKTWSIFFLFVYSFEFYRQSQRSIANIS